MTFTAWTENEAIVHEAVIPSKAVGNKPETTDEELKEFERYKGVDILAIDFLQRIRSSCVRRYPRCEGDAYTPNGLVFLLKNFNSILKLLRNTEIQCIAISLDSLGVDCVEKNKTRDKRRTTVKDPPLSIPPNNDSFFKFDAPLPCDDMNRVFITKEARLDLYDFVTGYLTSERFYKKIPLDKEIVFSGGLRLLNPSSIEENRFSNWKNIPVTRITWHGTSIVEHLAHSKLAEGDIDAPRLALSYKKEEGGIRMVESKDGDVLMVLLMLYQRFHILYPNTTLYFKTSRSAGKVESLVPSYDNPNQMITLSRSIQVPRYVNIGKMRELIISHMKVKSVIHKSPVPTSPVELWVLVLIMSCSGHDFVDTDFLKGVGDRSCIFTLCEYVHMFPRLVVSGFDKNDKRPKAFRQRVYRIDMESLEKFTEMCYIKAAIFRTKRSAKANQKLSEKQFEKKISENANLTRWKAMAKLFGEDPKIFEKPTAENEHARQEVKKKTAQMMHACAARLAWIMHYYGNGSVENLHIKKGYSIHHVTKLPIHGFTTQTHASKVHCPKDCKFHLC